MGKIPPSRPDSDKRVSQALAASDPSSLAVIEVGLAKLFLQDFGFPMHSKCMHGHQYREKCEQPMQVKGEDQAENHDINEDINGITDAGIETGGDEFLRLRCDGE